MFHGRNDFGQSIMGLFRQHIIDNMNGTNSGKKKQCTHGEIYSVVLNRYIQ